MMRCVTAAMQGCKVLLRLSVPLQSFGAAACEQGKHSTAALPAPAVTWQGSVPPTRVRAVARLGYSHATRRASGDPQEAHEERLDGGMSGHRGGVSWVKRQGWMHVRRVCIVMQRCKMHLGLSRVKNQRQVPPSTPVPFGQTLDAR